MQAYRFFPVLVYKFNIINISLTKDLSPVPTLFGGRCKVVHGGLAASVLSADLFGQGWSRILHIILFITSVCP